MSIVEFEAYQRVQVASKLPLEIQTLATHRSKLLAGTKNGCLLIYEPNVDSRRTYEVHMCRTFARNKCIQQLQILITHDLLLCLTDLIAVHDTQQINYPSISTVNKTKGATAFDCFVAHKDVYLAVINRRRLQFFQWRNREFMEMTSLDMTLPDNIQKLCWCDAGTLAVSVRDEYFLVSLKTHDAIGTNANNSDQLTSLFTTGSVRNAEPHLLVLQDKNLLALMRDDTCLFVDWQTKQITRQYPQIKWSETPSELAYDPPYLIAIMPKHVEVRSLKPSYCVQRVAVTPKHMTVALSGHVYQAASHDIWCLCSQPNLKANCQRLSRDKHYELALLLAEQITDEPHDVHERRLLEIKHKFALHLFTKKQFAEACEMWTQTDTEVIYVIGLFPDMLPVDIRANINYPTEVPTVFTADERKQGLVALTKYLSAYRTRIARGLQQQPRLKHKIQLGESISEQEKAMLWTDEQIALNSNLMPIVDTTLLRCYLETNDMLVASLLRLPDSSCNVAETEKLLTKRKKYYELFLLYERRGMHRKALELLRTQADDKQSRLSGLDRTVHYLQNLGATNLDLIFEHSTWVLKQNVNEGLKIFTEDCDECRALDRERVLQFLLQNAPDAVIPYLEHIIWQWDEDRRVFHDTLAEYYVTRVKHLMVQFVESLPEGHDVPAAGQEPGKLGQLRSKMLTFFEASLQYSPEMLLVQLPHDALYEERALLLGRLKRYEQALAIYTNILRDHDAAERYCQLHYNASDTAQTGSSQIFLTLLRMYAQPPDTSIVGLLHSTITKPRPNIAQALRVLRRHAARIDTVSALCFIPDSIALNQLWTALGCVLQRTADRKRGAEIHRGLFNARLLSGKRKLMSTQSTCFEITHNTQCKHCNKKISNSAFARQSDGTLMHYYCYRQLIDNKRQQ